MALQAYLSATTRLLQNPAAPNSLYSTTDLTAYINTARGQLAGEAECIRAMGSLALTAGTRVYPFSAITFPTSSSVSGIQGVINARTTWITVGAGQAWIRPRPFEWFSLYKLNNPAPQPGRPNVWSQYAQGVNGSIYVDPIPDAAETLSLDCVCYPVALTTDATVEAIPYLWTDAVSFFAAYYALLSAQNGARQADAERMMQRYTEFTQRARRFATPSVLPYIYPQTGNPSQSNQLGVQPAAQGGG